MLDLRKRGKVGRIGLVGSNGCKFPGIKSNLRLFLVLLIPPPPTHTHNRDKRSFKKVYI